MILGENELEEEEETENAHMEICPKGESEGRKVFGSQQVELSLSTVEGIGQPKTMKMVKILNLSIDSEVSHNFIGSHTV
ncbi:hypothetical protein CR513_48905, partial [Mucuna pruriens]